MKTTFSITFFLSFCLCLQFQVFSQNSYEINEKAGKLFIKDVKSITLTGTESDKLSIVIDGEAPGIPDKAKGLKLLNPDGLEDNTGIGLSIQKEDGMYVMRRVSNKRGKRYTIKVPDGWFIQYETNGYNVGKLIVNNVQAELDVSVNYNKVELNGVSGPMAINSVYGAVIADFNSIDLKGPITLYSVYSDVNVTLPSQAKASLEIGTSYGDIYSDIELDYPVNKGGLNKLSSKNMTAEINGGGPAFKVKSSYGSVFFRTKDMR